MADDNSKKVLVTGGAGYVGSALIPKLLDAGHFVKVLDLYLFGEDALNAVKGNPNLEEIKGDIRHRPTVENAVRDCDSVIHLACISNDPSFELDPELGKSINYDAFVSLVEVARDLGVRRFIYASSSSVYGLKTENDVTEDLELEPLTDYSRYKALCEEVLLQNCVPGFTGVVLRPATVCGYSPRLRLDLTVNILTNHALTNRLIKVFGGDQLRPNIHISDMTNLYVQSLQWPESVMNGQIYNAGYQNHPVMRIAEIVQGIVGNEVKLVRTPTDDNRSYHISSEKIGQELGFRPQHTIEDAVRDLKEAFDQDRVPDSMTDERYYNIKRMSSLNIQ